MMIERNKSYEIKDWFCSKLGRENNFDLMNGWVIAILKETEKAVYAMVHISGRFKKCFWIPKSCLEVTEIGYDDGLNHPETLISDDYNAVCEAFRNYCHYWDL